MRDVLSFSDVIHIIYYRLFGIQKEVVCLRSVEILEIGLNKEFSVLSWKKIADRPTQIVFAMLR